MVALGLPRGAAVLAEAISSSVSLYSNAGMFESASGNKIDMLILK